MQENEDDPPDVQNATPVAEDVKKGQQDKLSKKSPPKKSKPSPPRHCCKSKSVVEKRDCCEEKRQKHDSDLRKTQTIHVFGPPCRNPKIEIIPRHCFTKEEYLEYLATPKRRCEIVCETHPVQRKVRPVSPRIEELALPIKRKLMLTLQERASILRPEMLDHLIQILEGATALTPEQAEDYVRDKSLQKKKKKAPKQGKKRKQRSKCASVSSSSSSSRKKKREEPCDRSVDLDVAHCQYMMALRFVRSILNFKCSVSPCEYKDIAEVVLGRLAGLLEYPPIGEEDRKSRQMLLIANLFACWIAGVLMEVAERRRAELEAACEKKRKEQEELAALQQIEEWYDEGDLGTLIDYDDDDSVVCEIGEDGEEICGQPSCTRTCDRPQPGPEAGVDDSSQYDAEDLEDACASRTTLTKKPSPIAEEPEAEDSEVQAVPPACEEEVQAVCPSKSKATCTDMMSVCLGPAEAALSAARSRQVTVIESMCSRMSTALGCDVPFLTFARILDVVYGMIECESENRLCDPLTNRLHRAIYVKLERAVNLEEQALLGERTKDVLDVIAGKVAIWMHHCLDEHELCVLDHKTPEVESAEVRCWSKWIEHAASLAEDWTVWIKKVSCEANTVKTCAMTRKEWQDWTSNFEQNALLWRRAYLEALHQQHHKAMMIPDRKVVKTLKDAPKSLNSEVTIKDTNLAVPSTADTD